MSAERQEHMARSRGDNLARVHKRLHGRERGNRAAADAFHRRNKDFLNNRSSFAAKSKDKNLKPREYNWDSKTQKLTKVSEKGGDYLHYVHHGTTDIDGNFIPEETTYHDRKGTEISVATKGKLEEKLRREGVSLLDVSGESIGQVDSAADGLAKGFKRKGGNWGKTKGGVKHYKKFRGNQHVSVKPGDEIAKQVKKNFKKVKIASNVYDGLRVGQALHRDYQEGDVFGIRSQRVIFRAIGGGIGRFFGGWGGMALGVHGGPVGIPVGGSIGASWGADTGADIAGGITQYFYEGGERRRLENALIRSDIAQETPSVATE